MDELRSGLPRGAGPDFRSLLPKYCARSGTRDDCGRRIRGAGAAFSYPGREKPAEIASSVPVKTCALRTSGMSKSRRFSDDSHCGVKSPPVRGSEVLVDLADLAMTRYPHGPLRERAMELRDSGSMYGAVYLVLAEAPEAPLVTCDARIARAHGHRAQRATSRGCAVYPQRASRRKTVAASEAFAIPWYTSDSWSKNSGCRRSHWRSWLLISWARGSGSSIRERRNATSLRWASG